MGENNKAVPRHVAIILDGNGRWAKKRMLPRNAGHAAGSKNVEKICEAAWNMGIEYVTMYAFSTENWSRPQEEVDALMKLLHSYLKDCIKTSKKNNMQVRVIGDIVEAGDTIAEIWQEDGTKLLVQTQITGILRGLLRDGYRVTEHFKVADVDPRKEELSNCFLISDKARCIAGSVLELVCAQLWK